MYITINDVIGSKTIDLSYPIHPRKEITVVSMFSNNVQYWLQGSIEVLLKTGKKIVLIIGVYMDRELNSLIRLELKSRMDPEKTYQGLTSWKKSQRWSLAWKNSIILITSKTVDPATPYLRIMPHKRPIVEYSDGQFQFKVPFIMYTDFESILEPIQGLGNNPRISTTRGVNVHTPSGWCIQSEFAYSKVKDPLKLYRGKDCVRKFCDHIIGEARHLYCSFPENPMEPLTKAQLKDYKHMSSCHICFKPFREGN